MRCPVCTSDQVYRSRSGSRRLPWPLRLLVTVARCHQCERRTWFVGPQLFGRSLPEPTRPGRRLPAA